MTLLFYGRNEESLAYLNSLSFPSRELTLRADSTRLTMYRAFAYTAPSALALAWHVSIRYVS
jgi:hypothetical protein